MKEQLSTSENPKLKQALAEKYKEETEKLPKPTGWRIVVLPFRMDEKPREEFSWDKTHWTNNKLHRNVVTYLQWGHNVTRIRRDIQMGRGARKVIG